MFVRNRQALFFTLFTPLIIMTIFGLIASSAAACYFLHHGPHQAGVAATFVAGVFGGMLKPKG